MVSALRSVRVVVTGATGFIGMHLLRGLHAAGAEVVAVVVASRRPERVEELGFPVDLILIDDVRHMGNAVQQAGAQLVVHLNGYVTTERSVASLQQTLEWNVVSTVGLLTACAEMGVERVVLLGSCEEYGTEITPFDARLAPDPSSPYGASKAAATAYARLFANSLGLPTVVLRPTVVYGPGQSERMLIAQVMRALAAGQAIDVTEGQQTRDFLYVTDLVEAMMLALTVPGAAGRVLDVGSGQAVTVRDCLQRMEALTGRAGLVRYGARAYSERETFHYAVDPTPACEVLGWEPKVGLDEGLRRVWEGALGERSGEEETAE